jgi:uncharacterized Ntn-hydrolase superfamily protein
MTFTILVHDPLNQTFGGATATGNICVGGLVLRGDARGGMTASQGAEVSTLWGEDVITLMKKKFSSEKAIKQVISSDTEKEYRQLSAIDLEGNCYCFSGKLNEGFIDHYYDKNLVVSGNTLTKKKVIQSIKSGYNKTSNSMAQRLITALKCGHQEGGDKRGLMSAAILIISKKHPPIDLRVDFSITPLHDLEILYQKFYEKNFFRWFKNLPIR